jgi:hypothetical protein
MGGGGFERGGIGGGEAGAGGFDRGGFGQGISGGDFGGRGLGGQGFNAAPGQLGDRYQSPSRGQLNNFLGLPSDEGLHNAASNGPLNAAGYDVNRGSVEGPRGGQVAGISATGPLGNTVGRAAAVGPNGGVVAARGFEGAGGAVAASRLTAASVVHGPFDGDVARGAVAAASYGAGFVPMKASGRYMAAAAVRSNFNDWGLYGSGWYARYPGAWLGLGWAAGTAWYGTNWNSLGNMLNYSPGAPLYYDYGNNVTYQNSDVYVNGQNVGTADQYYNQAVTLAASGNEAGKSSSEWFSLGVFALCKSDEKQSAATVQLAINSDGILAGNYTDATSTQVIHGSLDKKTQRVAFTVGDNTASVVETGLYNLTKDEAPALIHFGNDRTEQWLLVRLRKPAGLDGN